MALNINGRMKVKTLRADFKKEFGLALRVYDGRSFADDNATLASIRKGDSVGGEFSPQRNTKVGNLEDKIMDMFGIKTQVSGSDDSYLCDNDKTLAGALEADEKLMVKRDNRANKSQPEPAATSQVSMVIADIIGEIKNTYSDHEDFDEMIEDLEDGSMYDYWAEKLCSDKFGKNIKLAKPLYKIALKELDSSRYIAIFARTVRDPNGLNDEEFAISAFKIALEKAKDIEDQYSISSNLENPASYENETWAKEFKEKILENIAELTSSNEVIDDENGHELIDDDMFEDLDDDMFEDENEALFIRANGEESPDDDYFLQLAVSAKVVDEIFYVFALGRPYNQSTFRFKIDGETGKVWQSSDPYEWEIVSDENRKTVDECIPIEDKDADILNKLSSKLRNYVVHASELDEDNPDDIWYVKKDIVNSMTEEYIEAEDGFEESKLFIREGEVVLIENAVECVADASEWPFYLGLGDIN